MQMDVSASMVSYIVNLRGGSVRVVGNSDAPVERVRVLREGKWRGGTLYVSAADTARAPKGRAVLVSASDVSDVGNGGDDGDFRDAGGVESPGDAGDAVALLEAASDALVSLQEWDARLEGALSAPISLAEFLRLAEDMIPYSFGFYDSNIAVLGASSNFNEWAEEVAGEEGKASDAPNGTLPNSILSNLFEDEEYQEAPRHKEPFYYTNTLNDLTTLNSYCVNLFNDGNYAARFVVNLPLGEQRFPHGAERVIEHFADKLTEFFIRFTGSDAMFGNSHDSVHNLFRGVLFGGEPLETGALEKSIASYGWLRSHRFVTVKFIFFEAVKWESAAQFICTQLERGIRCSCALPHGRTIAWVVNTSLLANESGVSDEAIVKVVADTVRVHACKAGISDELEDLSLLRFAFGQSEAALNIGQMRNPHFWYYRFGDYLLDYLMSSVRGGCPPELLVSKKLLSLVREDEKAGSEYVKTLRCYLDCNQNATHAAERLFMHRTSLLRRLERMVKISGIDFNDPEEVFYLALSLRLLEA